jgi:hypothetical protein
MWEELSDHYTCMIEEINYTKNFTVHQSKLLEWYLSDSRSNTINDIWSLLSDFKWIQKQLQNYLNFKLSCELEYDDRMQISNLLWALEGQVHSVKTNTKLNLNNVQKQIEVQKYNSNVTVLDWSITVKIYNDIEKKRVKIWKLKFDIPKPKSEKVKLSLDDSKEQIFDNWEIKLYFKDKKWRSNNSVKLSYYETSKDIIIYHDRNNDGDFNSRKKRITIEKQQMRSQHDKYYFTTPMIDISKLVPDKKSSYIKLKIQKTD